MALKDALKEIGIYNIHNLCSNGMPMIHYVAKHSVLPQAWSVTVKGKKFADVSWYENGSKWFSYCGKDDRKEKLKEALDFVKSLFPDVEMVKGPWSSTYISKSDMDKTLAMLKEKGVNPKAKTLKCWNGSLDYKGVEHWNVAAYSIKQAIELLNKAYGSERITIGEFKGYWNDCWGNDMDGIKPELGVWKQVDRHSPQVKIL